MGLRAERYAVLGSGSATSPVKAGSVTTPAC